MNIYLPVGYVQLVMYTLLYNKGLGRPLIKFELYLFVIYCRVMEIEGVFLSHFMSRKNTAHVSSDLEENLTGRVT